MSSVLKNTTFHNDFPFDVATHLITPSIDEGIRRSIAEVRACLEKDKLFQTYLLWCTDETLHRFLIARKFNVKTSAELITGD